MSKDSEPVSPADTIRAAFDSELFYRDDRDAILDAADEALDVLLAVGERDKAEIAELRGELAVAYGGPDRDGKQREWFSALDRAKAEIVNLRELRVRDGARIAQLTEALEKLLDCKGGGKGLVSLFGGDPAVCETCAAHARAVLADEEDARPVAYTAYTWKDAATKLGVRAVEIPAMIASGALTSLDYGFVTTDSVERAKLRAAGEGDAANG